MSGSRALFRFKLSDFPGIIGLRSASNTFFHQVDRWFSFGILCLLPVVTGATLLTVADFASGEINTRLVVVVLLDFLFLIAVTSRLLFLLAKRLLTRKDPEVTVPLHRTLAKVFTIVAVLPTAIVAVVASLGLNVGLGDWLSTELTEELERARNASDAYVVEKTEELYRYAEDLARRINDDYLLIPNMDAGQLRQRLQEYQEQNQNLQSFVFIIDSDCHIVARGQRSYLFHLRAPPINLMHEVGADETEGKVEKECGSSLEAREEFGPDFMDIQYLGPESRPYGVIYESPDAEALNAIIRFENAFDRFMLVTISVSSPILRLRASLVQQPEMTRDLVHSLAVAILRYSLLFLGIALVLVIAVIQLGFVFAERLSRPVEQLALAAQEVGDGNLNVAIDTGGNDEIAKFSRVFKQMIRRLDASIAEQVSLKNAAQVRERTFSEVLSNVTAGVIGVDRAEIIVFMNKSAGQLLGIDHEQFNTSGASKYVATGIRITVPEFSSLLDELQGSKEAVSQSHLRISRLGKYEDLFVRIANRTNVAGEHEGYVVAFDDVTELVRAESKAAWSRVAQQIAHEVKNAMTPISLSVSQLQSRIGGRLGEDERKRLERYTSTIRDSMTGLIRISNEFSQFAKLPDPILRSADIVHICRVAANFESTRGSGVSIDVVSPSGQIPANVDKDLLHQALVNLLKNAREAIVARKGLPKPECEFSPRIIIKIQIDKKWICIQVIDNGIGYPPARSRKEITKPFVTFREGGSGLGLAYTERIIEGHGGELDLMDGPMFEGDTKSGAMAQIRLLKPVAGATRE